MLDRRPTNARIRRGPADFAVLFAGLTVLALVAAGMAWPAWHMNRIYSGVTVGGMPVGGLTRAAAVAQLQRSAPSPLLPALALQYEGRIWPVTMEQPRTDGWLAAVNRAYLVGRQGDLVSKFAEQVAALLGLIDVMPAPEFEISQARAAVSQAARDLRRPARPALQIGDTLVPGQDGLDVDVETTAQELLVSLQNAHPGETLDVPLHVIPLAAPQMAATATPVAAAADTPAANRQPLLLHDGTYGLDFAIDPATVAELIISTTPLRLDIERLTALLREWAVQIDVAARDARLRFDPATGAVGVLQTSRNGRSLDIAASIAGIERSLAQGATSAPLVINELPAAVDSNHVAEMGIRELVASATTYFAGSSAERVHNIEVGAEKFDGIVIPPNGVFSFNGIVQDVSAANGFEEGLVIWGDRTAVGVGGGICQVSTTIFRAAYAAGFPILERYNHGYVVSWYGEPGLDATIFTPSVDFRFRNDTGAHLLLEPVVNAGEGTITFNLYGTRPARQVVISEPEITDIVAPEPPIYAVDPSVATGERRQVDWEKEGMTVAVQRTITENGETRVETLKSKYQPWRAVYLVGSEAELPPTPTPTVKSADGVTATTGTTSTDTFALPAPTPGPTPEPTN